MLFRSQGKPTIVRKRLGWSSKAQIDATTTNMIIPGDFFEEIIDVGSDGTTTGTVSTNKVRFLISSVTKDETAGTPHSFNIEAVADYLHSSQYGGS